MLTLRLGAQHTAASTITTVVPEDRKDNQWARLNATSVSSVFSMVVAPPVRLLSLSLYLFYQLYSFSHKLTRPSLFRTGSSENPPNSRGRPPKIPLTQGRHSKIPLIQGPVSEEPPNSRGVLPGPKHQEQHLGKYKVVVDPQTKAPHGRITPN